jgi:putative FmdB family regulatory protein
MPLYEYQCDKCGDVFETMQRFSDEPLKVHDACGGPVHRLLSAPALQFKGSGWYITDYAKNASNGKPGAANGEATATDSKKSDSAGSKTDASPATSTPSTSSSDKK